MPATRILFPAICLFVLAACAPPGGDGGASSTAPAVTQEKAVAPASGANSEDVAVSASCGGGVTGGGSGVTLTPNHHIISWRRVTAGGPRTETDLGADEAFAADIHRHLSDIGFADIDYNQPSNMTCSLSAGEHSVAWGQGDPRAPASVLAIHNLLMSAGG